MTLTTRKPPAPEPESRFQIEAREREKYKAAGWLRDDYHARHRALDILQQCGDNVVEGRFLEAGALYGRFAEWEGKRLSMKTHNMSLYAGSGDYARLNLPAYVSPEAREQAQITRIQAHLQRHNAVLSALLAACPQNTAGTLQVDNDLQQRYVWFCNVCRLFFEMEPAQ